MTVVTAPAATRSDVGRAVAAAPVVAGRRVWLIVKLVARGAGITVFTLLAFALLVGMWGLMAYVIGTIVGLLLEGIWNALLPRVWDAVGVARVAAFVLLMGYYGRPIWEDVEKWRDGHRFYSKAIDRLGHDWAEAAFEEPVTWDEHLRSQQPRVVQPPAPPTPVVPTPPTPPPEPDVPELAPEVRAGPIVATRGWLVEIERSGALDDIATPVLRSVTAADYWPGRRMEAVCNRAAHGAPRVDCSCGIYAVRRGAPVPTYAVAGVSVIGEVELSGWVIELTLGYRAERARIVGPLQLILSCDGGDRGAPCAGRVVAVSAGLTELRAQCKRHMRKGAEPIEDVVGKIIARLELRYGVDVVIDKEGTCT